MTPKRYKLLRDLPNVKAGAIVEKPEDYTNYYLDRKAALPNYAFEPAAVENNPEWFEEVEEKEFTLSDMLDFAWHVRQRTPGMLSNDGMKAHLAAWKKNRNQ